MTAMGVVARGALLGLGVLGLVLLLVNGTADLEVAVREGGVDWPAAYAEDTWKRFKKYD